jgi:hypothetical protein
MFMKSTPQNLILADRFSSKAMIVTYFMSLSFAYIIESMKSLSPANKVMVCTLLHRA